MINDKFIIVYDFETAGLDVGNIHDPIQVACVAIDPKSLEIVPGSEFKSDMNVRDINNVDSGALAVNKFTKERILAAPSQEAVWRSFVEHCGKFNKKPKNEFTAPISAGKNIRSFDWKIVERLSKTYGHVDSKGKPYIFSNRLMVDLEDMLFMWFDQCSELPKHNMDDVRTFLGMSHENAHDAMQDVKDTAEVIIRFMKYQRAVGQNGLKFKGAFKK